MADRGRVALEVRDLVKTYRVRRSIGRSETVPALSGVSFHVLPSRTLGVVGESGSGKSTIGRCVLGLTGIDSGEVILDGVRIDCLSSRAMRPHRRRIQMVFQNPQRSFNPLRSIRASVEEALHVRPDWGAQRRKARVAAVLQAVNLGEELWERRPSSLSGGQLQRAAIARALAPEPAVVYLDEPTSALDTSVRGEILTLLQELQLTQQAAYVFVSHDLEVVRAVAHDVVVMYQGQVVERASARELFREPAHPYTRALLAASALDDTSARLHLRGDVGQLTDSGCRLRDRCPLAEDRCAEPAQMHRLSAQHEVRCWKAPVALATEEPSGTR